MTGAISALQDTSASLKPRGGQDLSPAPATESHLEVGMQGGLRRVNDEVAQREAESLRVFVEHQRPGTPPAHADALPSWPRRHRWSRVVRGRGDTIPPPLSLRTEGRRGKVRISRVPVTTQLKNPSTFRFLGDEPMTSHLDALVRPAVYSPKCPHKVKLHPRAWGGGTDPGWIWTEGREEG